MTNYEGRRLSRQRRGRRLSAARKIGRHTLEQFEDLRVEFRGRCVRCLGEDGHQQDHIVPVYLGGSDGIENIQPLCFGCNFAKGNETFNWLEFRRQGGKFRLSGSGKKEQEAYNKMPKRFTATEKWIDPWFSELALKDKMFWIFLLDNCDHAGVWQVNWRLVRFHISPDFQLNLAPFSGRIHALSEAKWFIPKFVEYQYGALNPDNRVHQSVISLLMKEGAYKLLTRPLNRVKDKDKDLDKAQDKARVKARGGAA